MCIGAVVRCNRTNWTVYIAVRCCEDGVRWDPWKSGGWSFLPTVCDRSTEEDWMKYSKLRTTSTDVAIPLQCTGKPGLSKARWLGPHRWNYTRLLGETILQISTIFLITGRFKSPLRQKWRPDILYIYDLSIDGLGKRYRIGPTPLS